ncbi:MAG: pyridoxal 5'-phosphate synthase, partial [Actinomycetota bacterium]|nr:pyridoxal 5'-phosphate synthase [Actinomycetota bacterium]
GALVFYWRELGRQVRVEGTVRRTRPGESQTYFATRPRASRLGAWASRQSDVIPSRRALEERVEALAAEYADGDVPLPPFWGGYRLSPDSVEFWQHRDDRLHDSIRYRRDASGGWALERLSP